MNEILRSILSNRSVTTEDGVICPLHSSISQEEGNFLQEIIRTSRPQVSLEVGCAYGISSLFICEALREVNARKHIIIDPYQHSAWKGTGLANLRRAGYANLIDFHDVLSYQYLSRLTEERASIDFAFIDGAHTFDYVLVDFFLVDKLLKPGGIVILDDLLYPSIRSVCRYVLSNLRYTCVGPQSRELLPRIFLPDSHLNPPDHPNYAALQKLEHDRVGEGHNATRHWTDHKPF
jgi:predicted O-methyltransferase YrrM